jgi:hypothetical protein
MAVQLASVGTNVLRDSHWILCSDGVWRRTTLVSGQATNVVTNPRFVGATVGTIGAGGALPTGWSIVNQGTVQYTVLATGTREGVPFFRIRIHGTPDASGNTGIRFNDHPTTVAQQWALSMWIQIRDMVAYPSTLGPHMRMIVSGAANTNSSSGYELWPLAWERRTLLGSTATGVTSLRGSVLWANTADVPLDFTLDIGAPQLEIGVVSMPVLPAAGTIAAATRSTDNLTYPEPYVLSHPGLAANNGGWLYVRHVEAGATLALDNARFVTSLGNPTVGRMGIYTVTGNNRYRTFAQSPGGVFMATPTNGLATVAQGDRLEHLLYFSPNGSGSRLIQRVNGSGVTAAVVPDIQYSGNGWTTPLAIGNNHAQSGGAPFAFLPNGLGQLATVGPGYPGGSGATDAAAMDFARSRYDYTGEA